MLIEEHQLSPHLDIMLIAAQMQLKLQQWQRAERSLLTLLEHACHHTARCYLLLGIARIKLERFALARETLLEAKRDGSCCEEADAWLLHLDGLVVAEASDIPLVG